MERRRIEANRQNALMSTGPRTAEGKAKSAKNAIKHGLLSELRVIPGLERQEDWDSHLEQTLASLGAEGHVEVALAERAAFSLWRLSRLARYEREATSAAWQDAEGQVAQRELGWEEYKVRQCSPVKQAERELANARECLSDLEQLAGLAPEKRVAGGSWIVATIGQAFGIEWDEIGRYPGLQGYPDKVPTSAGPWTACLVRGVLEEVAEARETNFANVLDVVTARARQRLAAAESSKDTVACLVDQYRRKAVIPTDGDVQKICRYEAHLVRCLHKDLHELQRLQAARQGGAPAPAALDVTVVGSTSEN